MQLSEINNTMTGIKSSLDEAQGWISDWENKKNKITQVEQQKEKKKNFKKWGEFKKYFGQHAE